MTKFVSDRPPSSTPSTIHLSMRREHAEVRNQQAACMSKQRSPESPLGLLLPISRRFMWSSSIWSSEQLASAPIKVEHGTHGDQTVRGLALLSHSSSERRSLGSRQIRSLYGVKRNVSYLCLTGSPVSQWSQISAHACLCPLYSMPPDSSRSTLTPNFLSSSSSSLHLLLRCCFFHPYCPDRNPYHRNFARADSTTSSPCTRAALKRSATCIWACTSICSSRLSSWC